MADKTVIVTILDETWASPGSVLDLFLESFRVGQGTQRFLNHLVVVALDNQAFQYCNAIHPHCFQLPPFESKIAAAEGLFTTPDHLMLNRRRNDILLQVIELGYNLVFTVSLFVSCNQMVNYDHLESVWICGFQTCDFKTQF